MTYQREDVKPLFSLGFFYSCKSELTLNKGLTASVSIGTNNQPLPRREKDNVHHNNQ